MMFAGLSAPEFAASICAANGACFIPCCGYGAPLVNTKDSTPRGKSTIKVKFTEEEDMRLYNLVRHFGSKDWCKISQLMVTRNPRQCRERWNNYVNPALRTDPWTPEEDILLEKKYAVYGPKWNKISKFFVNRSDNNIRNRWMMIARHRSKIQKSPISPAPEPAPVKRQPFQLPQVYMPVVKDTVDEKRSYDSSFESTGSEQEDGLDMLSLENSNPFDIWNDLSLF